MGWGSGGVVGAVMGLGPAKAAGGQAKGAGGPATSGAAFNPANGAIFCSTGDFVCGITPNLGGGSAPKAPKGVPSEGMAPPTPPAAKNAGGQIGGFGSGHLSYASDGSIPKAVAFILSKIGGPAPLAKPSNPVLHYREHSFGTYA